ncbi:nuclear transport factor 2 family protein [uncultured Dubosiella sp.]|uniref:nuclear transport factor 2 family protein n=1 Tax=uncultured Dubosiella sp. TaxID=1937011 RepID=UPI00272F1D7E|nr:nuclear transport factor 2 family protein [uncultured Dubosiella sp.]
MTKIQKALALIATFQSGDAKQAYDLLVGRHPEAMREYFDRDAYIQHNPQIADGLSGLGAALASMAEQGVNMVYTTVHQVLAQGDFALAMSEGTFGGEPTAYYDLFRVENGKIAEHWDVMASIPSQAANSNGKF